MNAISRAHRAYFAAGGLGLLIGDGRLTYAPERAVEAYYAVSLAKFVTVTLELPARLKSGLQPRPRPGALLRHAAARGLLIPFPVKSSV